MPGSEQAVVRRTPHTTDHAPLGTFYACLQCGKVSLQLINGSRTEQLSAWLKIPEVKTLLSLLREEIVKQSYELLKQ
jgi:hypothetical protein